MIPPLGPLHKVYYTFKSAGVEVALGGSGLLYSLGLIDTVRDWDLTTDATTDHVMAALGALPWAQAPTGDQAYATACRLHITPDGADIDLMAGFAIRCESGVVRLPTIVCGALEGVPVGSPEVWAVAYWLMGRHPKADLLNAYIRRQGFRSEIQAIMLAQPLPATTRDAVASW
ncbi:MAG TPA: hypothetical protein VD969_11060 [Symbiobacteriaceae bacterium]|nr:hypothetical protein [Symbiobacteriaceae bacterium]